MNDDVPNELRKAALFQMASGVANVFVLPLVLSMVGGICGAFTFGVGQICALGGCVLLPLGLLEIASGAVAYTDPRRGVELIYATTWAELAAVFAGGLHTTVVGLVVRGILDEPDVQLFLAGPESGGVGLVPDDEL